MRVIVVGAGIIGALTAYRLAQQGADVTVIETGQPCNAASGASFGWINASFYVDEDHFHLRFAAMDAHRRLATDLGSDAVQWPGCLCWEEEGDAFEAQYNTLVGLGYRVRKINATEFANLEPTVRTPKQALLFSDEGAVDMVSLTHDALVAGAALGVRVIAGVAVDALNISGERVSGVRTALGDFEADHVVLATGTATQSLLADVGVYLPMLRRPGLMLKTAPMPLMLRHILVSPGQEIRQDAQGCFLSPTAASHQSDDAEEIDQDPVVLADAAQARVRAVLGVDLTWQQVTHALRPVPQDGLPVIGACGPAGLYTATMHSGATLAPLAAELAAAEIMESPLSNAQTLVLAPYRPTRFTA